MKFFPTLDQSTWQGLPEQNVAKVRGPMCYECIRVISSQMGFVAEPGLYACRSPCRDCPRRHPRPTDPSKACTDSMRGGKIQIDFQFNSGMKCSESAPHSLSTKALIKGTLQTPTRSGPATSLTSSVSTVFTHLPSWYNKERKTKSNQRLVNKQYTHPECAHFA